jgi:hypothetical protein
MSRPSPRLLVSPDGVRQDRCEVLVSAAPSDVSVPDSIKWRLPRRTAAFLIEAGRPDRDDAGLSRDLDSRFSNTSLREEIVSPLNTGFGRRTLSQPRLAITFCEMSVTL